MPLYGQQDTVVLEDLTKALVSLTESGLAKPVLDAKETNSGGLFIGANSGDVIRICNEDKISVWVEGRLVSVIDQGCEIHSVEALTKIANKDTFYLHFYSEATFEKLRLDRIAVISETEKLGTFGLKRSVRNPYREFLIVGLIFLLSAFGFISMRFPNRIKYLYSRGFSLKESSYELVEVEFFKPAGWSFGIFLSLMMGFFWVSFTQPTYQIGSEGFDLGTLSLEWVKTSGLVLLLLVGKWILATIVSGLFSTSKIYEYQLFDFINASLSLGFMLFVVFYVDFIFELRLLRGETNEIYIFIVLQLIISMLFLALKFVNNYPHKKLLIITYLCATEIFPAIILIGWFYK